MANVKGRGVKVEISNNLGTSQTITSITLASPAVATKTAHGYTNDQIGYFDAVVGMVQLEDQAVRVKNVTANTFELQGLNTTNYTAFVSGLFRSITSWNTLGEATSYSIGGGASEKLDVTTLADIVRKEEAGLLPVSNVSLNVIAQDSPSAAMQVLEAAVQSQSKVTVRITLGNGAVRIFRAEPSIPGEDVQSGAVGTGSMDFAVYGFVLKLAA